VIDGAVKKLLDEGLDQNKELESDRLGVIFASRVGYDATAYATFLERLRTLKGDDQAFFKTHPKFSDRLTVVQTTIREQGLKPTGILLADRFTHSSTGKL
jgi:predicted Zn-dependent protease